MDAIEKRTVQDIKNYVKFLDTPDNKIYQENGLLIMECFSKAIEFIEKNAKYRQPAFERVVFPCTICGEPFASNEDLSIHRVEEHNGN